MSFIVWLFGSVNCIEGSFVLGLNLSFNLIGIKLFILVCLFNISDVCLIICCSLCVK